MENVKKVTLGARVKSMLKVDFKRMFSTPLLYIMCGICFAMPIAVLVMTSMVGAGEGGETIAFTSVWQAISSVSGSGASMDLTSMCNMNLTYFAAAIFICLFISLEFKCGYIKNLFVYRSKKNDYVISKTVAGTVAGMIMILCFFVGAMIGGAIAGLPFAMEGFNSANLIACMLAKLFIVGIFSAIAVVMATVAKQRTWLSVCLGLFVGALFFMTIPIMTPLNASVLHVILCLVGGIAFAVGLGAVSNLILNKTNIL